MHCVMCCSTVFFSLRLVPAPSGGCMPPRCMATERLLLDLQQQVERSVCSRSCVVHVALPSAAFPCSRLRRARWPRHIPATCGLEASDKKLVAQLLRNTCGQLQVAHGCRRRSPESCRISPIGISLPKYHCQWSRQFCSGLPSTARRTTQCATGSRTAMHSMLSCNTWARRVAQ